MRCYSMEALTSSVVLLLFITATETLAFVCQPSSAAIASAGATRCGATSFFRNPMNLNAHTAEGARGGEGAATVVTRTHTALRGRHSNGVAMTSGPSLDGGELSRGAWAGRVLGAAAAATVAVTQGPGLGLAEVGVGEGGLPDGARQFSNFVKVKNDWAALGKSIKSQGDGVTSEEWKNVALFLRKVYQLGGDLEFLAGTFPSDKKKTAVALVKNIQKEVQAADVPAREKNTEAFLAAQLSVEKKFDEFMDYFNDVPDEL